MLLAGVIGIGVPETGECATECEMECEAEMDACGRIRCWWGETVEG